MMQELDPDKAVMKSPLPVVLAGGLGWWCAVFLPIVSLAGVVHLNGGGG